MDLYSLIHSMPIGSDLKRKSWPKDKWIKIIKKRIGLHGQADFLVDVYINGTRIGDQWITPPQPQWDDIK